MKKRILTDEELKNIISAREKGANWSQIKRDIGIPRHVAKREYEEWLRKQSSDELNGIRLRLAEEEFVQHRNHLLKVADFFTSSLEVPTSYDKLLYDSSWLMYRMESSNIFQNEGISPDGYEKNMPYNNKLLFKALKDHTREKVSWDMLSKWEQAWDDFKTFFEGISHNIIEISSNVLDLKQMNYAEVGNILDTTADGVPELIEMYLLPALKQVVLDKDLLQGISLVKTLRDDEGVIQSISPEFVATVMRQVKNRKLPKELTSACRQIMENVCRRIEPKKLRVIVKDVRTMRDAISLFQESLNPLVLRPLILRTRCNLCPI